jgi:hypothetical protein
MTFEFVIAGSSVEVFSVCGVLTASSAPRRRPSGGVHLEEADHCYARDTRTGKLAAAQIATYRCEHRARADGSATGLPFGRIWDDSPLAGWRIAQLSLVWVVDCYRKGPAAAVLCEGVERQLSGRRIGAVVMTVSLETCDAGEAWRLTLAARQRGKTGAAVWLASRAVGESPRRVFPSGGHAGVILPDAVDYCLRLGARICGDPVLDEETGIFSVPCLTLLKAVASAA